MRITMALSAALGLATAVDLSTSLSPLKKGIVKRLFDQLDADGDELLSEAEFQSTMDAYAEKYDLT